MNGIRLLLATVAGTALTVSVAFANPGLLPNHPGYPAQGKSPVTGQATVNDAGQGNATGQATLNKAAMSHDAASMNDVTNPDANRMRIIKSAGAGQLPQVEGPLNNVKINPAGATSTVISR